MAGKFWQSSDKSQRPLFPCPFTTLSSCLSASSCFLLFPLFFLFLSCALSGAIQLASVAILTAKTAASCVAATAASLTADFASAAAYNSIKDAKPGTPRHVEAFKVTYSSLAPLLLQLGLPASLPSLRSSCYQVTSLLRDERKLDLGYSRGAFYWASCCK